MTTSTTGRVAALLLAFDVDSFGQPADRSVAELARAVGRERSQVSRVLAALRQAEVVEQDPHTRRYRLGWRIRVLAARAGDQALVRTARPILKSLVSRSGEVALLSVQEGNRSLTVMLEESQNSLRGGGWVGRRSAMHYTACGRAMLFDADDSLVEALTTRDFGADPKAAPNSPRTFAELLARLRAERRQGFSCASEELEVGLTSVGGPVRDIYGDIVAAVSISGPTPRMSGRIQTLARFLTAASATMTKSLIRPSA
jgi:DNA-binding IclR family transcriptional regulator